MKKILINLLAFFGLISVFFLIWFLGDSFFTWIKGLDKEVAAAGTTALIGLIGLLYVQWNSKVKEISDNHRPAKIEVYNTFFDIVERYMNSEDIDNEALDPEHESFPQDLRDQFSKLSRGMIIWASPQVITAWGEFRELAEKRKTPIDTLLAVDKILQAIRKDLGNSNFGLKHGDVVKLYLKNPGDINTKS